MRMQKIEIILNRKDWFEQQLAPARYPIRFAWRASSPLTFTVLLLTTRNKIQRFVDVVNTNRVQAVFEQLRGGRSAGHYDTFARPTFKTRRWNSRLIRRVLIMTAA